MLGRLRGWLFGGDGTERLPERVREAIRRQQEQSEILIGLEASNVLFMVAEPESSASAAVNSLNIEPCS